MPEYIRVNAGVSVCCCTWQVACLPVCLPVCLSVSGAREREREGEIEREGECVFAVTGIYLLHWVMRVLKLLPDVKHS